MPGFSINTYNVIKSTNSGSSGTGGAMGTKANALSTRQWAIGICPDIEYGPTRDGVVSPAIALTKSTEWWDAPLHTVVTGFDQANSNLYANGSERLNYLTYYDSNTFNGSTPRVTSFNTDGDLRAFINQLGGSGYDMVELYEKIESYCNSSNQTDRPLVCNLTYENLNSSLVNSMIAHFDFGFLPCFSRSTVLNTAIAVNDLRGGGSSGTVKFNAKGDCEISNLGLVFKSGFGVSGTSNRLPVGATSLTIVAWLTSMENDPAFTNGYTNIFNYGDLGGGLVGQIPPPSSNIHLGQNGTDYLFGDISNGLEVASAVTAPGVATMVSVVVDNVASQIRLGIDGQTQATGSFYPSLTTTVNPSYAIGGTHFGKIHMLTVYERPLDGTELDTLFQTFKGRYGR